MRRLQYWQAVSGLVAMLLFLGIGGGIYWKLQRRHERQKQLATLPVFAARDLNGRSVANLAKTTGPLVLVYFEPDCDHCQRQASELYRHATDFDKTPIVWLSRDSLAALRQFAVTYRLAQSPAMRVLQITPAVAKALDFFTTPEIRIYNTQCKLVGRYRGETSAAAIRRKLPTIR
jgi:hypothetical protein